MLKSDEYCKVFPRSILLRLISMLVNCLLSGMFFIPVVFAANLQDDILRQEKILFHPAYTTPEIISGRFGTSQARAIETKAYDFVSERRSLFQLRFPDKELELIGQTTDSLGLTHLRFQQCYNGVNVWGCQLIVHFEKGDMIYLVGGQTIPTPSISTIPDISQVNASEIAIASLSSLYRPGDLKAESELVVFPNDGDPRLAWLVTLTHVTKTPVCWRVFVDVTSGTVLNKYNDVQSEGPDTGSGWDELGVLWTFPVYYRDGEYQMIDVTTSMYVPPVDNLEGVIVTYNDYHNGGPISADLDGNKKWDDNPGQRSDVSAYMNARMVDDYFRNTFGRNSFDDQGTTLILSCHDPDAVGNAYWYQGSIITGDGDGIYFLSFAAANDIVAHEFTHGVSNSTAGFIYQHQSGALGEHYSDFYGIMLDQGDWLLGEDAFLVDFYIRSLENPNEKGDPMHMSEYQNLSGFHINCGIPNHAAYHAINAVGYDKAAQIWYRALTTYLTPASSFYFWAAMIMQSTMDLYGESEIEAINAALDSVGLNTVYIQPEYLTLSALVGGNGLSQLWIFNPGPGTKQVTSISPTIGGVSVTPGPNYQEYIPEGDSSEYIVLLDAAGIDDCYVGKENDTLRFDIAGSITSQIKIPLAVQIGYTSTDVQVGEITTTCLQAAVSNTTAMTEFSMDGFDALYDASLMIGCSKSGEINVYRDIYGIQRMAAIDSIITEEQMVSFVFATEEPRIKGNVYYRYETEVEDSCEFILAEYHLRNLCDSSIDFYSGVLCDFDVDEAQSNDYAYYDVDNDLIFAHNGDDTRCCGIALLSGKAHNLRSISAPIEGDGLNDASAYFQLESTMNIDGYEPGNWALILSFGQNQLNPGDSISFTVAYLYSNIGSAGITDVLTESRTFYERGLYICGDANDDKNVNVGDAVFLVNLIFHDGPMPEEKATGDVNCDGSVNVGDAVYLVNYIFQEGAPEPCAACL